MYHYIINTKADYADEFSYPIVSSMTETERDMLLALKPLWYHNEFYEEVYFGANETLSFSAKEVASMIEDAAKTDEEELKYFQRYTPQASVDIVGVVREKLGEYMSIAIYDEIALLTVDEAKARYPEYFA